MQTLIIEVNSNSKAKELSSSAGDSNIEGPLEKENLIVKDLVIIQKYMGRIINTLPLLKEWSPQFKSRASMLAKGILTKQTKLCEWPIYLRASIPI